MLFSGGRLVCRSKGMLGFLGFTVWSLGVRFFTFVPSFVFYGGSLIQHDGYFYDALFRNCHSGLSSSVLICCHLSNKYIFGKIFLCESSEVYYYLGNFLGIWSGRMAFVDECMVDYPVLKPWIYSLRRRVFFAVLGARNALLSLVARLRTESTRWFIREWRAKYMLWETGMHVFFFFWRTKIFLLGILLDLHFIPFLDVLWRPLILYMWRLSLVVLVWQGSWESCFDRESSVDSERQPKPRICSNQSIFTS